MNIPAKSPEDYISQIPEERRDAFQRLRKVILDHLPGGFSEGMTYGMISYFVPHDVYPAGYHCDPKLPLPFMSIASQKNFIAFYHMGIYADKKLLDWFVASYNKVAKGKLDMGKSCIRFKNPEQIPCELIGELATKMTPQQWIEKYESAFRSPKV